MLTIKENWLNLMYMRAVFLPNFLPFDLTASRGNETEGESPMVKLRPSSSRLRWSIWTVCFILSSVYLIWLLARLGWVFWGADESVQLNQWVIHGIFVVFGSAFQIVEGLVAYHAVTNAVIFNSLYDNESNFNSDPDPNPGPKLQELELAEILVPGPDSENNGTQEQPEPDVGKLNTRKWSELSGLELVSYYVTGACFVVGLVVPVVMTAGPLGSPLYITSLPLQFQSVRVIALPFALLESWAFLKASWVCGCLLLVHALFLQKVDADLAHLTHIWGEEANPRREQIFDGIQGLRRVQHLINLFNAAHAYTLYTIKMLCMWCPVFSGYYGITHFTENPLLGAYSVYITLDLSNTFIETYKRAFDIPSDIQGLGTRARLLAQDRLGLRARSAHFSGQVVEGPGPSSGLSGHISSRLLDERRLVRQQIRSIRVVGLRVGEFGVLTQDTTINFFGFIFENLADVLIAYR